jgi:hypothetical protein
MTSGEFAGWMLIAGGAGFIIGVLFDRIWHLFWSGD